MSNGSSQSAAVLKQNTGASKVGTLSGLTVQERLELIGVALDGLAVQDTALGDSINQVESNLGSSVVSLSDSIEVKKNEAIGSAQSYTDQKIALLSGEAGNGQAEDQSVFISMLALQANMALNQFNLKEQINGSR